MVDPNLVYIALLPICVSSPIIAAQIGRALALRRASKQFPEYQFPEYINTHGFLLEARSAITCYEMSKNRIRTCHSIDVSGSVTIAKIRETEGSSELDALKRSYNDDFENERSEVLNKLAKTRKGLQDLTPKYEPSMQQKDLALKEIDSWIEKIEAENVSQLLQLSPELFA